MASWWETRSTQLTFAFGTKVNVLVHKNSISDLRGPNTSQKLCPYTLRGEFLGKKIILPIHSCMKGTCKLIGRKYRSRWLREWNTRDGSTHSLLPLHICFIVHINSTTFHGKKGDTDERPTTSVNTTSVKQPVKLTIQWRHFFSFTF